MFSRLSRHLYFLLPLILAVIILAPRNTTAQQLPKVVVSAPPTLSLTSDVSSVSTCAGPEVRLSALANSPGGHPITYKWTSTAGTINGTGPLVTWDLSSVAAGTYKASVEIESGGENGSCTAFSSTTVVVNSCPVPVCPKVEIVCPTNVAVDQPLTFSSNIVTPGFPNLSPAYNWSISAGTIIEGQGTDTIVIDTKGLSGQSIKATLSMAGYDMNCSASCEVQLPVPPVKCRKFDEFPDVARNDEKARLDNLAVELQSDPTATATIMVHPSQKGKSEEAQRRLSRILEYLVNSRHLDGQRIVTKVGEPRSGLLVELWTCPQGAVPPKQ